MYKLKICCCFFVLCIVCLFVFLHVRNKNFSFIHSFIHIRFTYTKSVYPYYAYIYICILFYFFRKQQIAFKVYIFVPLNQLIYFLGEYIGYFSKTELEMQPLALMLIGLVELYGF